MDRAALRRAGRCRRSRPGVRRRKTGWFTTSPAQIFGLGGNPPDRTVLYHTTDGGGSIAEPPFELPDVGAGPVRTSAPLLPLILGTMAALAIAASMAVRRRVAL